MGYSDFDWPQDSQLFPKHETVTQYLEDYAADIKHLIHFDTQVLDVNLAATKRDGQDTWSVKTRKVQQNTQSEIVEKIYDAVVVANGHFAVPFIPKIKGMKAWAERYPNIVSHSMYYKRPEDYNNKKTIIVGSGASGIDIAMQLMQACKLPLIQSQKSKSFLLSDPLTLSSSAPATSTHTPSSTIWIHHSSPAALMSIIFINTWYIDRIPLCVF
jgi:cation diffusion facilitator CzcD-associated flavoprotein CzcO